MSELPQFRLLPEDRQVTPQEDLDAAVQGALALPQGVTPAVEDPPMPLGRTWVFDYETGQFVRVGSSAKETGNAGAVEQWCLMSIHSARFTHGVFSDEFGMEQPDELLGEFAVGEALADWQRHLTEALLVHDRITAIENLDLTWDPTVGVLTINTFDVVTDEEDRVTIGGVSIDIERSIT